MEKTDHESAVKILADAAIPTGSEEVCIDCAYGRVLSADIRAEVNVPSFDRSPYDGYAFRAADTKGAQKGGITLSVTENIRAGQVASGPVEKGCAIRLMTGAMIPEGADAVCKYEDTDFTDTSVTIKREYMPGDNIIRAGEDIREGTLIAERGTVIDAGLTGALASAGMDNIPVYRRPLAGIISTGDELVDISADPAPGKIRNTNRYTMAAALSHIGIDTVYLGHAADDTEEIKNLIQNGYDKCDVIISTGGVSAGDYDLVPDAMSEAGFDILVKGVAMKPGMACAYGVREGKLMLALSGNPASSLTNLQCICYPALKKLAGCRKYDHRIISFELKRDFTKESRGMRFLRGHVEYDGGRAIFDAAPYQGNVVISSAAGCDAYAVVEGGTMPAAGTVIRGFCI